MPSVDLNFFVRIPRMHKSHNRINYYPYYLDIYTTTEQADIHSCTDRCNYRECCCMLYFAGHTCALHLYTRLHLKKTNGRLVLTVMFPVHIYAVEN